MPIGFKDIIAPAAAIGGQIIGMLGQGSQDRRQVKQQTKLTAVQEAAQNRLANAQQERNLQMWKDTNMSAQVEEAKKAGMSISALYGGGGASGQTTGGTGSVGGAQATDPSAAAATRTNAMMAAAQMALMGAQKENIEADTANKQAGVPVQTEEARSRKVKANIDEATEGAQRDKVLGEARSAAARGIIDEQTQKDVINRMHSEAVGAAIENTLKNSNIQMNYAKIRQIEQEITNSIKELSLKKRAITIQEINSAWQETMARKGRSLEADGLDQKTQNDMINAVLRAAGIATGQGTGVTEIDSYDNQGNHSSRTIRKN